MPIVCILHSGRAHLDHTKYFLFLFALFWGVFLVCLVVFCLFVFLVNDPASLQSWKNGTFCVT